MRQWEFVSVALTLAFRRKIQRWNMHSKHSSKSCEEFASMSDSCRNS